MKKYMRVCVLTLALLALMALPAFAGYSDVLDKATNAVVTIDSVNTDKLSTVQYTAAQDDGLYLLLVLDGQNNLVPTEDNILYVEQAQADGTTVTFTNDGKGVYPSSAKKSTVCLAGPGLDAPIQLANLDVSGVTVSGKVTSYLTGNATVTLLDNTDAVVATTTADAEGNYSFATVANGTYTMEVSKEHHVAREYEITVGSEAVAKDVKICPKGDVDMNGIVDIIDHQCLFEHLQEINEIEDAYQLKIANVKSDDAVVDILDHQRLFEHLQLIEVLFPVD